MKKLFKALLVLVLMVFAVGFYTVKAEELEETESENKATEVVEEKKEEKPAVATTTESNRKEETKKEEVKVEEGKKSEAPKTEEPKEEKPTEEPKAEEVKVEEPKAEETKVEEEKVEETKAEPKKEEAPSKPSTGTTKADDGLDPNAESESHDNTNDVHRHCIYYINDHTGNKFGPSSCNPVGSSGNKTFPSSQYSLLNDFQEDGYKYVFKGWYDHEGNLLTTEKGVKVKLEDPKNKCMVTYVHAQWNQYKLPEYIFNLIDEVSTSSHSWDNTTGHEGSFTFKFKTPESRTHYKFLYYKMDDVIKNPGDTYEHDITGQGYDTKEEETFYAWWQADVTLILLDGAKELGRLSSFEAIGISDILDEDPKKEGYRFLGWTDAEGNDVDEDATYEPDEASKKPTPKEVKLYAKWEKVVKIKVTKTWDDGDNEKGKRTNSVTVHVKTGEETVDSIELSEENDWSYEFEEPEFDGETQIEYTVDEDAVDGYNTYITGSMEDGFEIVNVLYYETVTITKVWDDFDNEDGLRPETVTVRIYAGEEEIDSAELSEQTDWTATFEKLDVYKDGEKIEYSVTEDKDEDLDNYYELVSIEGDPEEGFTVTNKEKMGQGGTPEDPDEPTNNNPKTGDNIISYVIMLMVSLTGFASAVAYLSKNKLAMNK